MQSLLAAGADAKASNRYGVTPLELAATNGNAAITSALLKAGADASFIKPGGQTILMTAARTGNADVVRMLLDHGGADVNAREVQLWRNRPDVGCLGKSSRRGEASDRTRRRRQRPFDEDELRPGPFRPGRRHHHPARTATGRL